MNKTKLKSLNLPKEPGVYRFIGVDDSILYIGRATSLNDRVKSYFSSDLIKTRGLLLVDMVQKAVTVEYSVTPSVFDAILLESELIHRLKPYYNTKEKDDKSGACIVITKEDLPKVFVERMRTILAHKDDYKNSKIFGPYQSSKIAYDILRFIRKAIPFFDKKSNTQLQKRFYDQLGLTPNVQNSALFAVYKKNISKIINILQGKRTAVVKDFEKLMKAAAVKKDYESAGRYRDAIKYLSIIPDVKFITDTASTIAYERIEAYDTSHFGGKNHIGVMTVLENGEPAKNQYRAFNIKTALPGDDIAATCEVLKRRFTHIEWQFPNVVVIDGGQVHLDHARKCVPNHIPVISVVKDDKHKAKDILGITDTKLQKNHIILANSEAHRFSIKLMTVKSRKALLLKSK